MRKVEIGNETNKSWRKFYHEIQDIIFILLSEHENLSYKTFLFQTTPCSQHMVLLPNIQYEDMMSLVQYMYTGQVFIHQDMLGRLLKTAQQLQVKGLIEQNQNSSAGSSSDENQVCWCGWEI